MTWFCFQHVSVKNSEDPGSSHLLGFNHFNVTHSTSTSANYSQIPLLGQWVTHSWRFWLNHSIIRHRLKSATFFTIGPHLVDCASDGIHTLNLSFLSSAVNLVKAARSTGLLQWCLTTAVVRIHRPSHMLAWVSRGWDQCFPWLHALICQGQCIQHPSTSATYSHIPLLGQWVMHCRDSRSGQGQRSTGLLQ